MRATFTSFVLLVVGCSRATGSAVDAPSSSEAPVVGRGPDPIEYALCGDRTDCRLESELWQPGAHGANRRVVAVVQQSPGPAHPQPPGFHVGPVVAAVAAPQPCAAWETWLTAVTSSHAARVQLLASDCSSDDRPPLVEDLGPGRIRYSFRRDEGTRVDDIALAPPRLERETSRGGGTSLTWNYGAFHGEVCEGQECSPAMLEAHVEDGAFAGGGWKTTELGECATLVDGTTAPGDDTSHGERIPRGASSSVRLLYSAGTLYVEVTDDVFVTKGLAVDALVFYSSSTHAMPGERGRTERLLMDGTLTGWDGKVRQVEVATGPSTRRFALTDAWPGLDDPEGHWRMAYEDTDDGRTFGPGQSTGKQGHELWLFTLPFACAVRGGALHVDRTSVTDPEKPIAP
jgi:hypothetical protein